MFKQSVAAVGAVIMTATLIGNAAAGEIPAARRFQQADKDKDGKVSKAELLDFHIQQHAAQDKNKDGKVSKGEFVEYYQVHFKTLDADSSAALAGDELDVWIIGMDMDKDGKVSEGEYVVFHESFFKVQDKDGDGYLVMEEMTQFHSDRFAATDQDKDGALTDTEHNAGAKAFHAAKAPACCPGH